MESSYGEISQYAVTIRHDAMPQEFLTPRVLKSRGRLKKSGFQKGLNK